MLVNIDNYAVAMEEISKADRLYLDTEGSGLHPWGTDPGDFHHAWKVHGDRICGLSAKAPGKNVRSWYFPFRHRNLAKNLPIERIKRDFGPLLNRARPVGFNLGYDLQMLYQDGVPIPDAFEEISTKAHLLNENEDSFKLKRLAKKYVRPDAADEEDVLKDKLLGQGLGKGNMWKLEPEEVEPYACDDVVLTEELSDFYDPHLKTWKQYDLWRELNDYAHAILSMEVDGLKLDVPLIQQYMAEAEIEKVSSLAVIRQLSGDPKISPDTHKRNQRWLKLPTTAREYLENILEQPGVKELMLCRAWSKVNGTYYSVFLRLMDAMHFLHANLNIIGTETGRLSGSKPPLHAVPRMREAASLLRAYKVKDVFVSDTDEDDLGEADYSQAELRIGSHCARERNMAEVYLREAATGIEADLHGDTARNLKVDRDQVAKRLNLSCQYGIGYKSFARKYRMSEAVSKVYLNKWHALYPGYRRLMNKAEEVAEARGYIRLFTGRCRHYNTAAAATHKASSNLIQGNVAEMIRLAITRIHKELRGYVKQKLTVHDSIVFGCKKQHTREMVPEIVRIMKDQPWCTVPQRVDCKVGKPNERSRWGKLEKFHKVYPQEATHAA